MSYHIMAEVAKRALARSIEAACERELAAHREQFKPKPAPIIKQPDPRWASFAPSAYDQLGNKLSNPYRDLRDLQAVQNGILWLW